MARPTKANELIALARGGDNAAFEALLVYLSEQLKLQLRRRRLEGISPSRSGADFVQDTLIYVQEHFARFSGKTFSDLMRWSWRILYHRHQHTRRTRRNRDSTRVTWKLWSAISVERNLPNPDQIRRPVAERMEEWEEAQRAYRLYETQLRPHERNVIELRLMEEHSYEQIAALVNRNSDAVRKVYDRAIDRLRTLMQSDGKQ